MAIPEQTGRNKTWAKKIFLTGASAGIGRATADRLLASGHEVWGTSRELSRLSSLGGLHPVQLDLADLASLPTVFESAWREAGHFDVLINNAGGGHFDTAELLDPPRVEEVFRTLVFAHIELCRCALMAMSAQGFGLIINVTSLASRLPVPYMAAYNAAKAAMASYTFSLQLELGERHIRVVDLQPADINTGFNDSIQPHPADDLRVARSWQTVLQNMAQAPPPDRVAAEIARLISHPNASPRITVGGFFQAKIAPMIFRFLPQRVRVWGLRNYYRI